MSKRYCYGIFPAGLTCRNRIGNKCYGFGCGRCQYQSKIKPSPIHTEIETLYKHLTFQRDMVLIRKGILPPI